MIAKQPTGPALRVMDSAESRLAVPIATLVAVATALMLQATRVFLSYTVFVIDQSKRVELGLIAIGVFLAFGLVVVVVRVRGARDALVLSAGVLVAARLGLQFWEEPTPRAVLGAATMVSWGWLLVLMLGLQREAAAFGVAVGLAIDLAIRIAFLTVDLPWMPTLTKDAISLALVAVLVAEGGFLLRTGLPDPVEPGGRCAASLVGLGPALAIYHLVAGNLGFVVAKADGALPVVGLSLFLGTALGLRVAKEIGATETTARRRALEAVAITLLLPVGLWLLARGIGVIEGWAFVAATALIPLLVQTLRGGTTERHVGIARSALWLTAGMLLQAAIIFAYFTFTGHLVFVGIAVGALIVAAWLPGRIATVEQPAVFALALKTSVVPVVVAIVVSGIALLRSELVDAGAPLPRDFTVMTYNIQVGFSRDNDWDLERTARTIEAQDPDIVILQEVTRGWVIGSGVDEVRWLSQRLDMPVVFGGASRDGVWGNAILTRAPVLSETFAVFSSTQNLRRGVVVLRLKTEAGDLWVLGTHLDNPDEAGAVRLEQVGELLEVWDGKSPAVLAGDFNAPPDSDVLTTLKEAGFVDTGASFPPEEFTMENRRRIDYVMTFGPIATREVRIPEVWTSDHKPVVAELTLEA